MGKFALKRKLTPRHYDYSETNLISMSEPDQSMTISELIYRYAKGLSLAAMKVPVYNNGKDADSDLRGMDAVDIQDALNRQRERVQSMKDAAVKAAKDRQEAATVLKAKQLQEAIASEMAERKIVYEKLAEEFGQKKLE